MKKYTPSLIVCVMLLWAIFYEDNPYAYYQLLRIVCFGVFLYKAIDLYKTLLALKSYFFTKTGEVVFWIWVFAILALIYNPFLPFHLERDGELICWVNINWLTIATIVVFEVYPIKEKAAIILAALLACVPFIGIANAEIERNLNRQRHLAAQAMREEEEKQAGLKEKAEREARAREAREHEEWLKERQDRVDADRKALQEKELQERWRNEIYNRDPVEVRRAIPVR
jgi:Family of unknown function (DUF6804)